MANRGQQLFVIPHIIGQGGNVQIANQQGGGQRFGLRREPIGQFCIEFAAYGRICH
jgi:hypothetical protein